MTARVKAAQNTVDKIIPLCKKIGITRIADITYLDKLQIPNLSVILPGTEDTIWVYSGKGSTKQHAKASGLMESIERFSSLFSTNSWKFVKGSYNELSRKYNGRKIVLHPNEVIEPMIFEYQNDMIMDFIIGFELFSNREVLVPAPMALFRYSSEDPARIVNPFSYQHTNGLASGNVIEEAICHALCEVIERDAWSLADLQASAIPYKVLKKVLEDLKQNGYHEDLISSIPATSFVDDASFFPDVDISELEQSYQPVKDLVNTFKKSDIPLLIKDITSDIGIPTFHASSVEWFTHNYGYFVDGTGTHPDARIALVRAITELSQNRVGNISGARDDLKKIEIKENDIDHYKRNWQFIESKHKIKFSDVETFVKEDILDDIKLILNQLKKSGFKKAIIVDLTNPLIGIPVVRAIVPGLETFQITKSVMGRRALDSFKNSLNKSA